MNVRDLIIAAAARLKRVGIPDARLEAESLLAHALGRDAVWIVAHPEQAVAAGSAKTYAAMIARRARHEPFAYVIGEKWFYGRRFRVTKDVLIPRPETEVLIEATLGSRFRGNDGRKGGNDGKEVTILDVGTGSGAIGLTLAAELPEAEAVLYDVSKKALDVARANARALKLSRRARLARLDIRRQPLPEPVAGKFHGREISRLRTVVVANLPYLPTAAWRHTQPEVRKHEPKLALVSGKDGLDHYRALFARLARWKRPPDVLAIEAEPEQFAELRRLALALMPDAEVDILKDLHGDERVLVASKRKRPVA